MARPSLVALFVACAAIGWSEAGVAQTMMTAPEPAASWRRRSARRSRARACRRRSAWGRPWTPPASATETRARFRRFSPVWESATGWGIRAEGVRVAGRGAVRRREPDRPVALDASGVLRVGMLLAPDNQRYATRVMRTVGVDLGLSFEREGRSMVCGTRFAMCTGARVELPLTSPREPSELRVRLAVRRAFGLYTPCSTAARRLTRPRCTTAPSRSTARWCCCFDSHQRLKRSARRVDDPAMKWWCALLVMASLPACGATVEMRPGAEALAPAVSTDRCAAGRDRVGRQRRARAHPAPGR